MTVKATHAVSQDDTAHYGLKELAPQSTFAHLGGRSVNLAHVLQCLWHADGSVTVCVKDQADLQLAGADRDLLAEALGLPCKEEMDARIKGVKERAQDRFDEYQARANADARAREAKSKADIGTNEMKVRAYLQDAAAAKAREGHK